MTIFEIFYLLASEENNLFKRLRIELPLITIYAPTITN